MGEERSGDVTWLIEPTSIALCEGIDHGGGLQVGSGPMGLLDDSNHGDSISRVMGLLEGQMTAGSYQRWMQGGAKLLRRFGERTEGVG